MKATLEFNLPEEEDEYKCAMNGRAYRAVLIEMDEMLRRRLKYEDLPEAISETIQLIRDNLYEYLEANDVGLHE